VAILSNRLSHTRFGGDPGIVGRSVRIGSQATTVVGVMPPGLILIGTDLWMPWGGEVDAVPRNRRQFTVVARLRPGASLTAANAELATLAGRTDQSHRSQFKEYEGWSLTAAPWAVALLEDMRPAGFLLLGAVALVLMIACANLAHLFLARSTTRQRELAVRLALGAGRWRLARHVLTETVLVALAGGAVGVVLAAAGMQGAAALLPAQLQMLDLHAAIDTRAPGPGPDRRRARDRHGHSPRRRPRPDRPAVRSGGRGSDDAGGCCRNSGNRGARRRLAAGAQGHQSRSDSGSKDGLTPRLAGSRFAGSWNLLQQQPAGGRSSARDRPQLTADFANPRPREPRPRDCC
jgi:hypothetical protein